MIFLGVISSGRDPTRSRTYVFGLFAETIAVRRKPHA